MFLKIMSHITASTSSNVEVRDKPTIPMRKERRNYDFKT